MLSNTTQDHCSKWILSEWLRFMDDPEAPIAMRYGLGPHWEAVEKMAKDESLNSKSKEVRSVSEAWMSFLLKLADQFSTRLGCEVSVCVPDAELTDEQLQTNRIANRLANNKRLSGRLKGAGNQGNLHLTLCPITGEASFSIDLPIPPCSRQITWLLALGKQLQGLEKRGVETIRTFWDVKAISTHCTVKDLIKDPISLQRMGHNRKVPDHANPVRLVFERTVTLQGQSPLRDAHLLEQLTAELYTFCDGVVGPIRRCAQ